MLQFFFEYGLFLAKVITVLAAVLVVVVVLAGMGQRGRREESGHIEVVSLNERVRATTDALKQAILSHEALKLEHKKEKKERKAEEKVKKREAKAQDSDRERGRVFVVDFVGDVAASAVSQLREEITAVLSVAEVQDEFLVRLESPGGMVHSYGLAASQLKRIGSKGIRLTVAVDNVAASGGYMMACIADRIISAPFAVLGSIGVAAQVANVHRLLQKNDIDVDVLTAGEYKRTLTTFGENTDQGRAKFMDELEDVHVLFKEFVTENRPSVAIDEVGTGEAWYGVRALQRQLVDQLLTSDEYITERCTDHDVFLVKYVEHKSRVDKLFDQFGSRLARFVPGAWTRLFRSMNAPTQGIR